MVDFKTPGQIKRERNDEQIASAFRRFKKGTGYSNTRIIHAMARSGEFCYTSYTAIHDSLARTRTI